jgi:hypothetical protein
VNFSDLLILRERTAGDLRVLAKDNLFVQNNTININVKYAICIATLALRLFLWKVEVEVRSSLHTNHAASRDPGNEPCGRRKFGNNADECATALGDWLFIV